MAAGGFVAFHKKTGLAPHLAIEELHAVAFAPACPGCERGTRADEARILAHMQRHGQFLAPIRHHLRHAPFAGLGHDHFGGAVAGDGALQFAGEAAGVRGVIEAHIVDADALSHERRREMAHGGEDEGDLLAMMLHIGRLAHHLGHEDNITRRIEALEAGDIARKLVAEDKAECCHAPVIPAASTFAGNSLTWPTGCGRKRAHHQSGGNPCHHSFCLSSRS